MQVKKQQLELDMEQQTGFKLGKEYIKAVYYHPAYLTSMQSTSREMPNWRKLKLESRLPGRNINNLRYTDDTTLMAESEEELKSLLMTVKEESEKVGLKLAFSNLRSWHLVPSLHGKQRGKQCQTLFFWAPKSLQMVTAAMKLKDTYSLEGKL